MHSLYPRFIASFLVSPLGHPLALLQSHNISQGPVLAGAVISTDSLCPGIYLLNT
jgi:hypothetical protein